MQRTPCHVPHCSHTTSKAKVALIVRPPDNVWICATHWRLVPTRYKAVKRRLRRMLNRAPDDAAIELRFMRASRRCTRIAIERAVGIA